MILNLDRSPNIKRTGGGQVVTIPGIALREEDNLKETGGIFQSEKFHQPAASPGPVQPGGYKITY